MRLRESGSKPPAGGSEETVPTLHPLRSLDSQRTSYPSPKWFADLPSQVLREKSE